MANWTALGSAHDPSVPERPRRQDAAGGVLIDEAGRVALLERVVTRHGKQVLEVNLRLEDEVEIALRHHAALPQLAEAEHGNS